MYSEIIQSIILGIAQGLTEFLPVSSTAHLILTPYFFSWEDPGLAFNVALHFGTLIAVLCYFRHDWLDIIRLFLHKTRLPLCLSVESELCKIFHLKNEKRYSQSILDLLIIATIPGTVIGFFLSSYVDTIFRHPLIIALALAFFGALLYVADRTLTIKKDLQTLNLKDSLLIGFAQSLAVIPGVSRSGITMTMALFLGIDRESAARFSFLLSTPIILGALISQISNIVSVNISLGLILGVIASAISGYLAIKYMLQLIQKISYKIFFWYRLVLAALIVVVYFVL